MLMTLLDGTTLAVTLAFGLLAARVIFGVG
jgi:hypothetical protein